MPPKQTLRPVDERRAKLGGSASGNSVWAVHRVVAPVGSLERIRRAGG
jgi:hypothetical protein